MIRCTLHTDMISKRNYRHGLGKMFYLPAMVGSIIPVMTVAAPSEVVVHGGISIGFPSMSTMAKDVVSEKQDI